MEGFGFSHWISVRARRLRVYRAIINSFPFVVAALVLLSLTHVLTHVTLPPSAWVLSLVWGPYLFGSFLLSAGFSTESSSAQAATSDLHLNFLPAGFRGHAKIVASTSTRCTIRLLTIVGGVRERLLVTRRGRGKTVCARGADLAWSSGPSTSPLDGMDFYPTANHTIDPRGA
jgi:hypothetical protein